MKKVVVISGYHNRTKYLEESIQSVLEQSYQNFEYHVFDDASTDDTGLKLLNISHKKFYFYQFENNYGFVNGLIQLINNTDSDYIAIHGSGDISYPHRLNKQVNILNKYENVGIVGGWYKNVNLDLSLRSIKYQKEKLNINDIKSSNPLSHGEVMFRRDLYEEVGGYDPLFKYSQDTDLWCRMAKFKDIHIIQEIIYKRIVRSDGVSYDPKKIIIQKKYSIAARNKNFKNTKYLNHKDIEKKITKYEFSIMYKVMYMVLVFIKNGNFKSAIKLIKKFLKL